MRLAIVGLFILLEAMPLHPQKISPTDDHAAHSKAEQKTAQKATLYIHQGNPNQHPAPQEPAEENGEYQRWGLIVSFAMALATIALAIYSAVQASAAKSTAKSVQNQAATLVETLKAMARQADTMERQEKILNDSVDVARDNAAAAKSSAQAAAETVMVMKAKDSPRIHVTPKPLEFASSALPILAHPVRYTVRLYGSTDATIVASCAEVQIGQLESFEEPTKPLIPMVGLPPVIEAQNAKCELSAYFGRVPRVLSSTEIEGICNGNAHVRFFGFIKYTDNFGDTKRIEFEYKWVQTTLKNLDGTLFGYWSQVEGHAFDQW